jgi:hypothetical protein
MYILSRASVPFVIEFFIRRLILVNIMELVSRLNTLLIKHYVSANFVPAKSKMTRPHGEELMLPVTNQLLTTSGRDPNIGVAEHVVGHEVSREAKGEGHYDNQWVRAGVGKPYVFAKILHVRGKARVQVGTGFGGHGAVGQHG